MTHINRRALLGAVPSAILAAAAAPAAQSEIERLVRLWKDTRNAFNSFEGPEEEGALIYDRHRAAEEAIAATRSTNLRNLYLKIIVADDEPGGFGRSVQQEALYQEAVAATGWTWEADSEGPEAIALMPAPAAQSPVEQAYWRWRADYRLINGPAFKGMSYQQFDPIAADNWGLCLDVLKHPCMSPRDFMLKILALTADGEDFADTDDRAGCKIVLEGLDLIGGAA
jgi:hypothetical protein